jgi:hypothetical protein
MAVSNAGGDLELLNISREINDLLVIRKLLTAFDIRR